MACCAMQSLVMSPTGLLGMKRVCPVIGHNCWSGAEKVSRRALRRYGASSSIHSRRRVSYFMTGLEPVYVEGGGHLGAPGVRVKGGQG